MVIFFLFFTTTDSWSFVLLSDLKLHRESWELSYIVNHKQHPASVDSLIISDLKVYFVSIPCV